MTFVIWGNFFPKIIRATKKQYWLRKIAKLFSYVGYFFGYGIICVTKIRCNKYNVFSVVYLCFAGCTAFINYECYPRDCEELARWLELAAKLAGEHYRLRCPIAAEAKIGKTWADVH